MANKAFGSNYFCVVALFLFFTICHFTFLFNVHMLLLSSSVVFFCYNTINTPLSFLFVILPIEGVSNGVPGKGIEEITITPYIHQYITPHIRPY